MTVSVHLEKATLAYGSAAVFTNINLDLPAGKWTALLGASGIGKSSLLRIIAGLTSPDETTSGDILFNPTGQRTNQIAYMAQTDLLLPWLTVQDNIMLGLKLRSHTRAQHRAEKIRAQTLLNQTGLDHAGHLYPHQLSGGMRQRAALARTLMENKPIVLMDEPFSAVDAITRYQLQQLAVELLKGKTVLFITHDPSEALRLANVIYLMSGHPASLKTLYTMTSATPRALQDPEVLRLQSLLFTELTLTQACCHA